MMVVVCNIHPPFLIMLGLIGCFLMSGICTFFGHRDCPCTEEIENNLKQAIKKLIKGENIIYEYKKILSSYG